MYHARTLLLSGILSCTGALAQTAPEFSSHLFSSGVHPTIAFLFEGTNTKYVESYWKDELKKISGEVISKKELIGAAVRIPSISTDTVRILMQAEQRKGSPMLMAHLAILTTSGYVTSTSDAKAMEGALAFVQQRSNDLRRQLAQQELTDAEKGLSRLRNELDGLQREKERAEAGIEKSTQRAAEAVEEQVRTKREEEELGPRIATMQGELATNPDEDKAKDLGHLVKDRNKLLDQNRKAHDLERKMIQKTDDLSWEIKKNVEDQARKSEAIAQQETLVNALRSKLADIK